MVNDGSFLVMTDFGQALAMIGFTCTGRMAIVYTKLIALVRSVADIRSNHLMI